MSAPQPLELELLRAAEMVLSDAIRRSGREPVETRLQLLEACAARLGGFNLAEYHRAFRIRTRGRACVLLEAATQIVRAIEATEIPYALALSALAREQLEESERKKTGAYHTDFRLAQRLAQLAAPQLTPASVVIDPACGAGMLLAALTLEVCGHDRSATMAWLRDGVCAADLSETSLRAATLVLGSLTDNVPALVRMRSRWHHGDSLLAPMDVWHAMAPQGFDAVVGNPPWEKVKLTHHEFLKATGHDRHYGAIAPSSVSSGFVAERTRTSQYAQALARRYPELAAGEPDLYIAFSILFLDLCRPGGVVAALFPGGLIRSQGTRAVRQRLFSAAKSLSISIIDNRARFFAIDTRFKFLAVALVRSANQTGAKSPIRLLHERGMARGLTTFGSAVIGRASIGSARNDWSIPEVRSQKEWALYRRLSQGNIGWEANGWNAQFCREVDMTKERPFFQLKAAAELLPLVEGRMVHQHRFGVKGYISGTGRRALWKPHSVGASEVKPQFWMNPQHLSLAVRARMTEARVGFCDIAGQTNERSLLAALIPAGVVCGNKVPTLIFQGERGGERLYLWLAIANSFVFDWLLRRVLTTTVNYFLLQGLPLPRLAPGGLPWRALLSSAESLVKLNVAGATTQTQAMFAAKRAKIESEVALAYGLTLSEMVMVFDDFPLLDRSQPPLSGESRSTITRDTVLAAVADRTGCDASLWLQRVRDATRLGARPFVPSEIGEQDSSDTQQRKHADGNYYQDS